MLFKLSLRNIRRSLRDYAIYFFTLIIGISVFYVFNAIGGQAAMLRLSASQYDTIHLLESLLSGVSVFVACVLGLLIVYASRFLMKRRNKEFALYMTLGMGKGAISAILLLETLLIGTGSLFVGLAAGIGLSQLMSALVANLFEADMTAYKFSVSGEAIGKTILYFAVMYLVVMLFNSVIVTRMKLIDLMQSGKKTEKVKLKNPVLCIIVFVLASAALAFAYWRVGWHFAEMDQVMFLFCIALGCLATFFIFWSVSGMLLRIAMRMRGMYYSGLNAFTFRQISGKVNTIVFSMSVICLMLFFTICSLSSAFSIRNSLNRNLKEFCAADCEIVLLLDDEAGHPDLETLYAASGLELADGFAESVRFMTHIDEGVTMQSVLGVHAEELLAQFPMRWQDIPLEIISVSDYDAVCRIYGKETVAIGADEYALLCNYKEQRGAYNKALKDRPDLTVLGHVLHNRYDACQDGFIDIGAQAMNIGLLVVPDDVVDRTSAYIDHIAGNFGGEDTLPAEEQARETFLNVCAAWEAEHPDSEQIASIDTRHEIYDNAVGLGAVVTFLGLYVGLVFLIACGAILAHKELSESVDSLSRYEMLRKIGAEETEIEKSLLVQTGVFFLLPLLLASVHSVFGMRLSTAILESIGTSQIGASMTATTIIILLIYGGYFLVTFFGSRGIIRERR